MVTASRIKDVLGTLKKGGENAKRYNYRKELALERLTGLTASHYVTPAMEHGTEYEPIVRSDYEMLTGEMVETVGLVLHPTLDFSGASPDGLIGSTGAIEIKAPQDGTLIEWIGDGLVVPEEHQPQCLWVMECCERDWCDFVAGHPRFKPFIVRMPRDEKRLEHMRGEVIRFEEEVNELVEMLRPWVIPAPPVDTRSDLDQLMAMIDQREMVP